MGENFSPPMRNFDEGSFYRVVNFDQNQFSMTCVNREYEVNIKVLQDWWLQLNVMYFFSLGVGRNGIKTRKFLLNGRGKLTFGGRGTKIWWRGVSWRECYFSRWGGMSKLLSSGWDSLSIPLVVETLRIWKFTVMKQKS